MSDFLIYAARVQDAGLVSLWVSLGSNKEGTRLMHVSPARDVDYELAARFPTRTFDLSGTDPVLDDVKNDLIFTGDGPTPERIQAAIEAHPLLADDLKEFFDDWAKCPQLTGDDMASTPVDEAQIQRTMANVKAMVRGFEAARTLHARKA